MNDHSAIQNAQFFGSGKPNFLFLNLYEGFAINGIHTSQISNIFSGFIFGLKKLKLVNYGHNHTFRKVEFFVQKVNFTMR